MLGISDYCLKQLEQCVTATPTSETSLRGKDTIFTDEQKAFIGSAYHHYSEGKKRVKLKSYMNYLRQQWNQQDWLTPCPSRQTAADILYAAGLRKPKSRPENTRPYYARIKRYFPHVQSVIDGKQVEIQFDGYDYGFILEMSKDMATDAIGGSKVGSTESAELVKQVFSNHCQKYPKPLATLLDNGKGNLKASIDLGSAGTIFIRAFPRRPQTKGQVEGEFGLFERTVSKITITGDSAEEKALSIVKTIVSIYCKLRNQTPRCSNCPFTPERLMKYELDSVSANQIYEIFKKEQDRKNELAEKRLQISAELNDLLEGIVNKYGLSGDVFRFKKSIKWIEISTIKQAEMEYAALSNRDNFDYAKQTTNYFYGIARNLQRKKDEDRKEKTATRRYALDKENKQQREKIQNELIMRRQEKQLQKQPHLELLNAIRAEAYLPPHFRKTITVYKNRMDEAIMSMLKKKRAVCQMQLDKAYHMILDMTQLSIEERYQYINYVKKRIVTLNNNKAKVVTPK